MSFHKGYGYIPAVLILASMCPARLIAATPGIRSSVFGKMPDGRVIHLFTMTNRGGMQVSITDYGARIVSVIVPDRTGRMRDVVEGFDNLAGYLGDDPYFGATIGRYANRIAWGRFSLDGMRYQLPINDPPNSLHGGKAGFDRRVWSAREISQSPPCLSLKYLSPNREEGYPGDLHVIVLYTLTRRNGLRVEYLARTDKDTVVNLTNHSYFNLAGERSGSILNEELKVNALEYTPFNANRIPTGRIVSVVHTPFDFRKLTTIGTRINEDDRQLKIFDGYSVNFVLQRKHPGLNFAVEVVDPSSGRRLEVYTTQPALQFYSGNLLDGSIHGKEGEAYGFRSAIVLETQHFPDSPNHPNFPSTELEPGQIYREITVYKFSAVRHGTVP